MPERISTGRLLAYSSLIFGAEFIIYPVLAILPSFYAAHSSGGLAAFGVALLASRAVYSWSGPLVGYLSDRIGTPFGRRRPWIVVGTVTAVASVALLFFPPDGAGPVYFGWCSALALFAFSLIDVPYVAWGSEMTSDYRDRSRVASYRTIFAIAGVVVFLALPLLPVFGGHSFLSKTVISRLGVVAIALIVTTSVLALCFGPRVDKRAEGAAAVDTRNLLRSVAGNRPLRPYLIGLILTYLAYGVQLTIGLPFFSSLGLGEWFGPLTILTSLATLGGVPVWLAVTYRVGKHRAWAGGLVLQAFAAPLSFAVAALFSAKAGLIVLAIVGGFGFTPSVVVPYAILGDLVDYDRLRSGTNHAGNYTALALLAIRLQTAVGGALAFFVLSQFHYTIGAHNPPAAQTGMLVAYFAIPFVCLLVAAAFIAQFPLDARRQAIVARRLERRA